LKKLFAGCVFSVLCVWPLLSFASNNSGTVTFLLATHDTSPVWIVFNVSGNAGGHACPIPNGGLGRYFFTANSTAGKEMLAILLSAEARQATVTLVGSGVCGEQNREAVSYLYIGDPTK
jgi:hypothetical protein